MTLHSCKTVVDFVFEPEQSPGQSRGPRSQSQSPRAEPARGLSRAQTRARKGGGAQRGPRGGGGGGGGAQGQPEPERAAEPGQSRARAAVTKKAGFSGLNWLFGLHSADTRHQLIFTKRKLDCETNEELGDFCYRASRIRNSLALRKALPKCYARCPPRSRKSQVFCLLKSKGVDPVATFVLSRIWTATVI